MRDGGAPGIFNRVRQLDEENPMTITAAPPVLATRILPRSRAASVAAIVGFAAFTAVAAQVSFRIPPIEVPFTGSTLAVLLTGGVLGSRRGAASMILYVLAGAIGLPVYAEQSSGFDTFVGATGGYLVGFIVAAYVVGKFAELRWDRKVPQSVVGFVLGSAIIYLFGVLGLMINVDMDLAGAIANGVVPFLVWDAIKAAAAGLLMPAAWKLTGEEPRNQ
jgi:biotin transport system substrate-specific component